MYYETIILFIGVATSIVICVSAQVEFSRGSCPVPGTKSNFDLNKYLGTWYEYERFDSWFELGMVCVRAVYGDNGDGSISVDNAGLRQVRIFGRAVFSQPSSIDGRGTVPNPAKPAQLSVSFSPVGMGDNKPNYYIVDTDYENYAVVFSCSKLPVIPLNIQLAWILTRVRGRTPPNLEQLKANLQSAGVDVSKFKLVDQTDCTENASNNMPYV